MKKINLLFIALLAALPFFTTAQNKMPSDTEKEIMAAKQVLMRVVGMKSSSFQFEKITSEKGLDSYEVIAVGGKVQVKGSSTIAMTRGAYDYMVKACNVQYTWSSQQVFLPKELPDYTIPLTVSPYKFRQYFNVCSFGYSTAYWQFADWEKELDWMALHGINMPLALTGQEAIWQKVYKDMGMTNEEMASFFTGPAFLPWQRMGNVYKHDGPLPQSYIDQSKELQKQILVRMRQLGMQPIVPGFAGIVPAAYSRLNPGAKLREMKGWCNFPADYKSYILAPATTDFITIGKSFIDEYRRTYGDVNYYLADLFNENEVPVSAANRDNDLASYGKSVSDAITAGDPEGVWVMQDWMFYNNENFWDKGAVKALLSQVPDNKMLIIDLANESYAGWKKHEGFYGKPWIYSTINNYGGNSQLGGNLPFIAQDASAMLTNAKKGNIVGFGISPEGIDNNEVVYELLTQLSWSTAAVKIKAYFSDYTKQRYGKTDDNINDAWLSLLGSVYASNNEHPLNLYQARPPFSSNVTMRDDPGFDQAADLFIKLIDKYGSSPSFKTDLALVITQFAGNKVDILLKRALDLYKLGNEAESNRAFDNAFELMLMMDGLTSTIPDQRFETLIENARKWGKDKDESDYYEADAKRQLTQWGNNSTPILHEYASKVWSGLIRNYYLGRWSAYAKSLQRGENLDVNEWETNWINQPGSLSKVTTVGDVNKYAVSLYHTAIEYINKDIPQLKIAVVKSGNNKALVTFSPLRDSLTMYYTANGTNPTSGDSRYDKPFEVSLPATIIAVAVKNSKMAGDFSTFKIPVSFGKTVTIFPQPSEKFKAHFGATLTDGVVGSTKFTDGNWLGFEGDNLSALITLEGSYKISKVAFSYLENGDNWIFAPHSVAIETSSDGVTYKSAGIHDFDDNKWSMAAQKGDLTISFPETEASTVRIQFFNRGKCPDNLPGAGKKAWMLIDEITVE